MELYYSTQCGNSKRVLFTLAELGVEVNKVPLDLGRGEHRTATYLAVNPLGKVPTLIDGSLVLWESNAIALYLAEKFPQGGLLPDSIAGRAELNKWLFFLAYEIAPPAWRYFFNALGFQMMGGVSDSAELTSCKQRLRTAFAILEPRLEARAYLLGELSLADLAYTPTFASLSAANFDLSPWPRVEAWVSGLLARPAWRQAAGA